MAQKIRNQIVGAWMARPIELMESPAYRVLSLSAHRVLSRIEVEYAHHAGQDNGHLVVTFDDFAEYGVHRSAIGPALAELEALGFIEITEHGVKARAAEYRRANKFLLMARPPGKKGQTLPDRWRRFNTLEEAAAAALKARKEASEKKKENEPVRKPHRRPIRNPDCDGGIAGAETVPLGMSETVPLSIFRREAGQKPAPGPQDDAGKPDGVVVPLQQPLDHRQLH
jgi:hypothetical protein